MSTMHFSHKNTISIKHVAVTCVLLLSAVILFLYTKKTWSIFYIPETRFSTIPKGFRHRHNSKSHSLEKIVATTTKHEKKKLFNQARHRTDDKSSSADVLLEAARNDSNTARSSRRLSSIQTNRMKQITSVCNDELLLSNKFYKFTDDNMFYYSKQYNFSYCKVPKVGSTFWTQAFSIFDSHYQGRDVFKQKRQFLHEQSIKRILRFNRVIQKHAETILVSRDPYSRLYSAFVDKCFLFMHPSTNEDIREVFPRGNVRTNPCPTDVTFQEFLDYTILSVEMGYKLNNHWAPIYNLCRPCEIDARYLIKQESFSTDVEYILKTLDIDKEKLNVILPALHDHRIEASIPGIIGTVYDKVKHNCIDTYNVTKRLWKSLQIQGFIRNSIPFPETKFENRSLYSAIVKDEIMDYINRYPMTSSERKSQREDALDAAYKEINEETIKKIQKLYEIDFKMFGYDMKPP